MSPLGTSPPRAGFPEARTGHADAIRTHVTAHPGQPIRAIRMALGLTSAVFGPAFRKLRKAGMVSADAKGGIVLGRAPRERSAEAIAASRLRRLKRRADQRRMQTAARHAAEGLTPEVLAARRRDRMLEARALRTPKPAKPAKPPRAKPAPRLPKVRAGALHQANDASWLRSVDRAIERKPAEPESVEAWIARGNKPHVLPPTRYVPALAQPVGWKQ